MLLKDDVSGKEFNSFLVHPCPHPAVIKKFGTDGKCNVSVYTCKGCGCHRRNSADAIICGYEEKGKKHEAGT